MGSSRYTLKYTYNIPQSISGEVSESLPVLNSKFARFDNNLTFVEPVGMSAEPARLHLEPPTGWRFETSWGSSNDVAVPEVSKLISGMILFGNLDYSSATVDDTKVTFAMEGDFEHDVMKNQFCDVLRSQQLIVGPLPSKTLLVTFIPATIKQCKGTSLTNALNVNVPIGEKLVPFNFAVIGTCSHELFHQWNAFYLTPCDEEGLYMFSEGFTNYFAVAALVRAKLIDDRRFGRFMCRYRQKLTSNPRYPGYDLAAIQAGLATDDQLFDLCYTKGPFVAILLDLALREDTEGRETVGTLFRYLLNKFGNKTGYTTSDLRQAVSALSQRSDGKAVQTFDDAFVGGNALELDKLFSRLGVDCDKDCNCNLLPLAPKEETVRSRVFSAN